MVRRLETTHGAHQGTLGAPTATPHPHVVMVVATLTLAHVALAAVVPRGLA